VGLFSNKEATKKDPLEAYRNEIQEFLLEDEKIEELYSLLLDYVCITNKRLIFVDKSIMDQEVEIVTLPFSKIETISVVKNSKMFALTDKIKIMTKNKDYELKFIKNTNVKEFYNSLARNII